jgi:hypothetical protein
MKKWRGKKQRGLFVRPSFMESVVENLVVAGLLAVVWLILVWAAGAFFDEPATSFAEKYFLYPLYFLPLALVIIFVIAFLGALTVMGISRLRSRFHGYPSGYIRGYITGKIFIELTSDRPGDPNLMRFYEVFSKDLWAKDKNDAQTVISIRCLTEKIGEYSTADHSFVMAAEQARAEVEVKGVTGIIAREVFYSPLLHERGWIRGSQLEFFPVSLVCGWLARLPAKTGFGGSS